MDSLTSLEKQNYETINRKDHELREFLASNPFPAGRRARELLAYLTEIKVVLGNLSNDLVFVATLLIKQYLQQRFGADFDAGAKAQGASGIDIFAVTRDGKIIVGELKTTKPYQPGFGAKQLESILKDLTRLSAIAADHRFMFVTDPETFNTLCKPKFAGRIPGVEIVDLVSGQAFVC